MPRRYKAIGVQSFAAYPEVELNICKPWLAVQRTPLVEFMRLLSTTIIAA